MIALGTGSSAQIGLPEQEQFRIGDLLRSKQKATSMLSKACFPVFEGDKSQKGACRDLDIIAYGRDIEARSSKIGEALMAEPL